MDVSRKTVEAFLEFVEKANRGQWDDEVVELTAEEWSRMGEILENRRGGGYNDFLQKLHDTAQHSTRLCIE